MSITNNPRHDAERKTDNDYERAGYGCPDKHDPEYLDRLYDNLLEVYDEYSER